MLNSLGFSYYILLLDDHKLIVYYMLPSATSRNVSLDPIHQNTNQYVTIFLNVDLEYGCHQLRNNEEDIPKTMFITCIRYYEFVMVPIGITNAPIILLS